MKNIISEKNLIFRLTEAVLILLIINLLAFNLNAKGFSAIYPEIGDLNKYKVGDIVKIGNIKFRVGEKRFTDEENVYANPLYKYNPKTVGEKYRYLEMINPEKHVEDLFSNKFEGPWTKKYLENDKGSMIMIYDPSSFWVKEYLKDGDDLVRDEYHFMFYAQEKAKDRFGEYFRLYVINIDNFTAEQKKYAINQLNMKEYKKYKTIVSPNLILIKNNLYSSIRSAPKYDEGINLINKMFDSISK